MFWVAHASDVRVKGLESFLRTKVLSVVRIGYRPEYLTFVCAELMLIVSGTYYPSLH